MDLEKRIEVSEKEIAELERSVQAQLKIKVGISNLNEFMDLVNQTIENLDRIKTFKFEIK